MRRSLGIKAKKKIEKYEDGEEKEGRRESASREWIFCKVYEACSCGRAPWLYGYGQPSIIILGTPGIYTYLYKERVSPRVFRDVHPCSNTYIYIFACYTLSLWLIATLWAISWSPRVLRARTKPFYFIVFSLYLILLIILILIRDFVERRAATATSRRFGCRLYASTGLYEYSKSFVRIFVLLFFLTSVNLKKKTVL